MKTGKTQQRSREQTTPICSDRWNIYWKPGFRLHICLSRTHAGPSRNHILLSSINKSSCKLLETFSLLIYYLAIDISITRGGSRCLSEHHKRHFKVLTWVLQEVIQGASLSITRGSLRCLLEYHKRQFKVLTWVSRIPLISPACILRMTLSSL